MPDINTNTNLPMGHDSNTGPAGRNTGPPGRHDHTNTGPGRRKHGGGSSPRPVLKGRHVNFRGYSGSTVMSFAALCGEQEPTITGGYAQWHAVARPLRRGVTVFDGYAPTTMDVHLIFGVWNETGWDKSADAGFRIEEDISSLEWMAGAHRDAGQSPYVYVNTYNASGSTTALVPFEYQQTAGITSNLADSSLWPWVIYQGVTWGKAWRNGAGDRVYQEATVSLMAFEGFSSPPQYQTRGGYFRSVPGRDDPLLIAGAPTSHALYVDVLASRIVNDPKNNPITGTRMRLSGKSVRMHIPHGYQVWVPVHQV